MPHVPNGAIRLVGGPLDGATVPTEDATDVVRVIAHGKVAVYVLSDHGTFIFAQGWSNYANSAAADGAP
jgi:hypothetical protein